MTQKDNEALRRAIELLGEAKDIVAPILRKEEDGFEQLLSIFEEGDERLSSVEIETRGLGDSIDFIEDAVKALENVLEQ